MILHRFHFAVLRILESLKVIASVGVTIKSSYPTSGETPAGSESRGSRQFSPALSVSSHCQ